MDWSLIPVASYVFFGLFLLVTIVHLTFCYIENERWRKITKCFTTLFLFIGLVIAIPTHPLPYIGLFCGLLGDFFLLKKHKVWPFVSGLVSFLIGHVFYLTAMFILGGTWEWWYIVGFVFYIVLFVIFFYNLINRLIHQRHLAFAGTVYFATLTSGVLLSSFLMAKGGSEYVTLILLGYIAFVASDSILSITLFKRNVRRRDFFIMATYLLAQALIAIGFLLIFYTR